MKFILKKKNKLTEDVYELIFSVSEKKDVIAGQFVIFDIEKLDKIVKRAYSIVNYNEETGEITLLIKNIGYGSNFICCMSKGEVLEGLYPLGVFTLKETENNKLFLATGTGLASIYFQTKDFLEQNSKNKAFLLFGVRYESDVFYKDKLEELKNKYNNFNYKIYLSRQMQSGYEYGYISSYLTDDFLKDFEEIYICGGAQVVKPIVEELKEKGKENIYFEAY